MSFDILNRVNVLVKKRITPTTDLMLRQRLHCCIMKSR